VLRAISPESETTMKKIKSGGLKISIETLRHLALDQVSGGKVTDPPLPSACKAGCLTMLPTTNTSISKL
jgi:hypothetical protein